MLVESEPLDDNSALFPRRVYILNHPEYETDTLGAEYHRDSAISTPTIPCRAIIFRATIRRGLRPISGATRRMSTQTGSRQFTRRRLTRIEAIPRPSKLAEAAQARSEVFVGSSGLSATTTAGRVSPRTRTSTSLPRLENSGFTIASASDLPVRQP